MTWYNTKAVVGDRATQECDPSTTAVPYGMGSAPSVASALYHDAGGCKAINSCRESGQELLSGQVYVKGLSRYSRIFKVVTANKGSLVIMGRPMPGELLEDDVRYLARSQVDIMVSLLEPAEIVELELEKEPECCRKNGIDFISFPIPDRSLPDCVDQTAQLSAELNRQIAAGSTVVIHCRAGIGRSGLLAACVLLHAGYGVEDAFDLISKARGISVPDTRQQYEWVKDNQGGILQG